MAAYHLLLNRHFNFDQIAQAADEGKRPRHAMGMLQQRLQASIYAPNGYPAALPDYLRARVIGDPKDWAMARTVSEQFNADDVLFCNSEFPGIHTATLCSKQRDRPRIAVFIHNIDRPRGRLALRLFGLAKKVDLFFACSQAQVDFLRRFLNLPESQVRFVWDHTDLNFFTPGVSVTNKPRPIIASVGLEKRDYTTLTEAVRALDVDVNISGFSKDAKVLSKTFPKEMPANVSRRFYEWTELVQLYRDADVVVISLFENRYAAGVQVLMEAMACRRPIVVSKTQGLMNYLDEDAVLTVQPGDVNGMQQAITYLLTHPAEAEKLAARAYQLALKRHNNEQHVEQIAMELQQLGRSQR